MAETIFRLDSSWKEKWDRSGYVNVYRDENGESLDYELYWWTGSERYEIEDLPFLSEDPDNWVLLEKVKVFCSKWGYYAVSQDPDNEWLDREVYKWFGDREIKEKELLPSLWDSDWELHRTERILHKSWCGYILFSWDYDEGNPHRNVCDIYKWMGDPEMGREKLPSLKEDTRDRWKYIERSLAVCYRDKFDEGLMYKIMERLNNIARYRRKKYITIRKEIGDLGLVERAQILEKKELRRAKTPDEVELRICMKRDAEKFIGTIYDIHEAGGLPNGTDLLPMLDSDGEIRRILGDDEYIMHQKEDDLVCINDKFYCISLYKDELLKKYYKGQYPSTKRRNIKSFDDFFSVLIVRKGGTRRLPIEGFEATWDTSHIIYSDEKLYDLKMGVKAYKAYINGECEFKG